jgi:hypothetical protein
MAAALSFSFRCLSADIESPDVFATETLAAGVFVGEVFAVDTFVVGPVWQDVATKSANAETVSPQGFGL